MADAKQSKSKAVRLRRDGNSISDSKSVSVAKSEEEDDEDYLVVDFTIAVIERDEDQYGCFGNAPPFLQFCRKHPAVMLTILCIMETSVSFMQHGIMPAVFAQLQLRFHFTTLDLAGFRSMFDVGAFLAVVPIILFAEDELHRPQWIGAGGIVTGLGALVMVMLHLMIEPYEAPEGGTNVCGGLPVECPPISPTHLKYVFMAAEFLMGLGSVPQYIMGITYLDESVTAGQSSLYTAIFSTCHLIGAVASSIVTSLAMKLPGDMDKLHPDILKEMTRLDELNADDEHHYGAWWLPLLIGVAGIWLGSMLILPFPKELSGAHVAHVRNARDIMLSKEMEMDPLADDSSLKNKFKVLFSNRTFVGVVVELCFRSFTVGGFVAFLPKYLITAFDAGASQAALLIGCTAVISALVGLLFGTCLQRGLHLDVLGNLKLCLIAAIGSLVFCSVFIVQCPPIKLIGYDENYSLNDTIGSLSGTCNQGCACREDYFNPVCWRYMNENNITEKRTFFSFCHAGCEEKIAGKDGKEYGVNCHCVPENKGGDVEVQPCSCRFKLWAFLLGLCWFGFSIYARMNPIQQIFLRSVHFKLRTTAMSIASLVQRCIATIPAPFVISSIMQSTCRIPLTQCTGDARDGRCLYFDRQKLSLAMIGTVQALGWICMFALLFAYLFYRPPQMQPVTEKESEWEKRAKKPSPKKK